MIRILFILLFFQPAWAQTPELNVKLVDYALSHLDQKVGHGVCRELVYEGLASVGATMGDKVCIDEVKPGDIYITSGVRSVINGYSTLEDYRKIDTLFAYEVFTKAAKGRDSIPNILLLGYFPHIAIVYKVLGDGRFMVLEQNVGKNLRQSRVVISTVDHNILEWEGKTIPMEDIWADFLRPRAGVFDYEGEIESPRLSMVSVWLYGLISWAYPDPFKRKPKNFWDLGEEMFNLYCHPDYQMGSWKCVEKGQMAGNP